ncbi:MAG: OmpA family protein [Bacteroidetes bacterium]|nr:OmpA family protein [Bacteroidota bacterium]
MLHHPLPLKTLTAATLGAALLLSGCHASKTVKGGAIGAGAGGAVGAVIGNQYDNTALGAIIGAAVGGTAGALIGRHMDKQAEELRNDLKGAQVERVGEGIKITFDSGLLFDVDKSGLSAASKTNLANLATTLNKYDDTDILIEGHTDDTGSDEHNMTLSKQRAESVAAYLSTAGVRASRFTTMGYGESQPIADNATTDGRQKNRRVEIAIYANKKMKRAAERGEL